VNSAEDEEDRHHAGRPQIRLLDRGELVPVPRLESGGRPRERGRPSCSRTPRCLTSLSFHLLSVVTVADEDGGLSSWEAALRLGRPPGRISGGYRTSLGEPEVEPAECLARKLALSGERRPLRVTVQRRAVNECHEYVVTGSTEPLSNPVQRDVVTRFIRDTEALQRDVVQGQRDVQPLQRDVATASMDVEAVQRCVVQLSMGA